MPCYFNGQITGDDRVSCSATPGKIWQSEPSLMSDPTTGQGIPMTGINPEWDAPLQGGAKYGDPTDAILTGAMLAPGVGPAIKGGKALSSKLPVKSIMDKLFKKTLTKPGAPVQKFAPNGQPLLSGGLKPVYKPGKPVTSTKIDPVKVTGITGGAGLVAKNIFGGAGPVTDRQVVQPLRDTAPTTPTTNKKNDGLLVDSNAQGGAGNTTPTPPPPADKDVIEKGLGGLWGNMQKPGYWSEKVEGGSGSWDNRLFRLGEMMEYMGTPLSKRGKNPADRWTTATAAANTLKATNAKASGISAGKATDAQRKSWVSMIPNETTLIKQFLKDKPGIISDSAPGTKEYANAASKAANYVWIGNQLIGDGIEPTPANIQKRAKKIKDEKK